MRRLLNSPAFEILNGCREETACESRGNPYSGDRAKRLYTRTISRCAVRPAATGSQAVLLDGIRAVLGLYAAARNPAVACS